MGLPWALPLAAPMILAASADLQAQATPSRLEMTLLGGFVVHGADPGEAVPPPGLGSVRLHAVASRTGLGVSLESPWPGSRVKVRVRILREFASGVGVEVCPEAPSVCLRLEGPAGESEFLAVTGGLVVHHGRAGGPLRAYLAGEVGVRRYVFTWDLPDRDLDAPPGATVGYRVVDAGAAVYGGAGVEWNLGRSRIVAEVGGYLSFFGSGSAGGRRRPGGPESPPGGRTLQSDVVALVGLRMPLF